MTVETFQSIRHFDSHLPTRPTCFRKVHESVYRNEGIIEAVRKMLIDKWDHEVILYLVDEWRRLPQVDREE